MRLVSFQKWGADVVSGGELFRAVEAGFPPSRIVFAGVGKTEEEIKQGINQGILLFNVESTTELERIAYLAKKMNKKVRIGLRVNPDIKVNTHDFTATGKGETKFGMPYSEVEKIISRRKNYQMLEIAGLHLHIGSQIVEITPYREALKRTMKFIEKMEEKEDFHPLYLDLGGGMGIIYHEEEPFTPSELQEMVSPYIENSGLTLILEPGRFIVGNAGILLSKIIYTKHGKERDFLIVDAGMNDLIRPALYGSYHRVLPLEEGENKKTYDIVGPICETGDFLAKKRLLPSLKENEYVAIMGAGAYGFSMSSNYNSRPRPAEVLIEGDKFYLIRRRETYQDLIRLEAIPPYLQK